MNALTNVLPDKQAAVAEEPAWVASNAVRRYRLRINALRVALFVAVVGGWELSVASGLVDPFFFGRPSLIVRQIWVWATQGTAQGPLWEQIATTMEETVIGFL